MSTELIGGLDEVGYGAWAGPIISVVAVFDAAGLRRMPVGVTDSKKTTEKRRSMLFLPIIAAAVDVGIGHVWPYEIDSIGVSDALQLCYARALHDLIKQPPILIVDGDKQVRRYGGRQIVEPKADLNHPQVSAASMIAKHFRDEIMISYAKEFPGYDFENNKGYGSKTHEDGIKEHGFLYDANNPDRYLHRKHYCRKVAVRLQK
jgi:ribonuclease HII